MKPLPFIIALAAFLLAVPFASFAADTPDSEILATVNAINQHEIDAANAALDKNPSTSVQDFARMMLKDHTNNMSKVDSLGQKLNLSLSDTASVVAMKAKESVKLLALKAQPQNSVDKAYIDAMVDGHTEALKKIDDLSTRAQNDDVKRLLQDTRVTVASHLDEAKKIQADLNQSKM